MTEERKYPTTATYFDKDEGKTITVTVLAPPDYHLGPWEGKVCPVEMPEGYPEPPEKCGTWFIDLKDLKF